MFSKKEEMVLFCLSCICFSLLPLFNFSHFHSSIVTIMPFLLLQSLTAIHRPSLSTILSWFFCSIFVYLLAFLPSKTLNPSTFSLCSLWVSCIQVLYSCCAQVSEISLLVKKCVHICILLGLCREIFPFPFQCLGKGRCSC